MPVPKRKLSRARRDRRSANKGIQPQPMIYCHTAGCTGTPKLPHQVCPKCGFYKGRNESAVKVVRTKADRAILRDDVRSKRHPKAAEQANQSEQQ